MGRGRALAWGSRMDRSCSPSVGKAQLPRQLGPCSPSRVGGSLAGMAGKGLGTGMSVRSGGQGSASSS
jgi:hypothetical protein